MDASNIFRAHLHLRKREYIIALTSPKITVSDTFLHEDKNKKSLNLLSKNFI